MLICAGNSIMQPQRPAFAFAGFGATKAQKKKQAAKRAAKEARNGVYRNINIVPTRLPPKVLKRMAQEQKVFEAKKAAVQANRKRKLAQRNAKKQVEGRKIAEAAAEAAKKATAEANQKHQKLQKVNATLRRQLPVVRGRITAEEARTKRAENALRMATDAPNSLSVDEIAMELSEQREANLVEARTGGVNAGAANQISQTPAPVTSPTPEMQLTGKGWIVLVGVGIGAYVLFSRRKARKRAA